MLTKKLTNFSKKHLRMSTSQCLFISFVKKDLCRYVHSGGSFTWKSIKYLTFMVVSILLLTYWTWWQRSRVTFGSRRTWLSLKSRFRLINDWFYSFQSFKYSFYNQKNKISNIGNSIRDIEKLYLHCWKFWHGLKWPMGVELRQKWQG